MRPPKLLRMVVSRHPSTFWIDISEHYHLNKTFRPIIVHHLVSGFLGPFQRTWISTFTFFGMILFLVAKDCYRVG